MTGSGVEVYKVQLMARWASAVVARYTRPAPLKAITADFRNALVKKRLDISTGQTANKVNNTKRAMNTAISKVAKGVKELDDAVKKLENKSEDKGYIINLETNTHRLLTTINESGEKAKCCCGLKCADKEFWWTPTPFDRNTTCGTCLPALRASLP